MNYGKTVLVVDDDSDISKVLELYLSSDGFEVFCAHSVAEMRSILSNDHIDLVLLDVSLPDGNGLDVMRELRMTSQIPIIVISRKSETVDEVLGLELGADDYVTKPFEPRSVVARVRSVLRRSRSRTAEARTLPQNENASAISFGTWQFDPETYRLTSGGGKEVVLSSTESTLLKHLAEQSGKVLSREDLMIATTGRNWEYTDRTIDILIARLRKKLETTPMNPKIIKTVRGAGYVFSLPVILLK